MFIECDDDTVVSTRAVLEINDVAVLCLSSRQGAGEILHHRPDVLVVDVSLSDDALGLVRDVRAEASDDAPRVSTMALVEDDTETDGALAAGFDAAVVKPVKPRVLVEKMRELLSRGKA
jgi:two-component system response regulator RstA